MTQRYVGQAMKRKEDPRLICGTSTYVDDLVLPGMLHMAVARSIHAHARIRRIDTSRAQKLPGVVTVVTGEEVAAHCGPIPCGASIPNMKNAQRQILAAGKVRFVGEPVAAVVALGAAGRGTAARSHQQQQHAHETQESAHSHIDLPSCWPPREPAAPAETIYVLRPASLACQ